MTVADFTHAAGVMARLNEIDTDMAERQNELETAADQRARLIRDWEERMAICLRKATGSDAAARKATALVTAIEVDDLYARLKDAEARYDALRGVLRVLETRAAIGMSILRAMSRVTG